MITKFVRKTKLSLIILISLLLLGSLGFATPYNTGNDISTENMDDMGTVKTEDISSRA